MGFTDAIKMCFRKYADFSGRAGRAEFWWFFLFTLIVGVGAWFIPPTGWQMILFVLLPLLLPLAAAGARRLHDTGSVGWWVLLPVVSGSVAFTLGAALFLWVAWGPMEEGHTHGGQAIVAALLTLFLAPAGGVGGLIVLLALLVRAGNPGGNRYGPPPGASAEVTMMDGVHPDGGGETALQCAHCGAAGRPGASFCTACGAAL